ncbi:MAG: hypothetical protein EXR86_12935 [Gammaproteobacteria bacterium]|nr:hypothetical protein [Gammaproteobacteria bacterium]
MTHEPHPRPNPHDKNSNSLTNGTIREIDGKGAIYFDGYWIRHYDVPQNEEVARRELIEQLTKRVFHHTEPGINTPSYKLKDARTAYNRQTDSRRKRVNAAMLAGALLNRGSDIFNIIFELKQCGIEIAFDNELLRECEACFLEAFELGKQVLHYSGEEGLDELWGEPLKAFYMPMADFYESRYIKIALSMTAIDQIASKLTETFANHPNFAGIGARVTAYARAAKLESETMKTDPAIFMVWPEFVASGDELYHFEARVSGDEHTNQCIARGMELVREGKKIIEWVAFARVPMPKTARNFIERCAQYVVAMKIAQVA